MNKQYWTRIINAFFFSCRGLRYVIRHERAFQQELLLAALFLPIAFWLPVSDVEHILLVTSVLFILVIEILNSAIETVVDRIGQELHELSKIAKDLGSAAVMVSIMITLYIWITIVFPIVLP